jgi:hypothetical protein
MTRCAALALFTLAGLSCFFTRNPAASPDQLFVTDTAELTALEKQGFGFSELVFASQKHLNNNKELYQITAYKDISDSLATDLRNLPKADKLLGVGMAYSHRLFNPDWLAAESSFYELVGIVARLDRAPFQIQSCGEIRVIYRLAYRNKSVANTIYSRLPMTVNVVFWARDENNTANDCAKVAAHWQNLSGNLVRNKATLTPTNLKAIEVNMQSVRWPSTVRPDFGGHAEYFLRVFKKSSGKFKPAPLENTPDAKKIRGNAQLKKEMFAWLAQNLAAIDQGTAVLPDKFLARKVTSVALNGPGRLANLPFRQIFTETEMEPLVKRGKYTGSAAWLLRRLDDMSCSGCHQGRAVAGFHFTGADRPETDAVNSILNAASPHFFADQPRRKRYAEALLQNQPADNYREVSLRSDHEAGAFGSFCETGGKALAQFGCNAGLSCLALNTDAKIHNLGICQPTSTLAGSACKNGSPLADIHPHKDRIAHAKTLTCDKGYRCQNVPVGFPGGMCSHNCSTLKDGEICGSIANLQGFNDCLARTEPFATCLSGNVRPGALKACDQNHACRSDYICARISGNKGGCIPPYFLFQLRVDGHNF